MPESPVTDLEGLAAVITDGMTLAVPKDSSGVAMAATRVLARRGVRGLHLVCVPTSGLQAEILIGAGAVRTIETSAVTLGEFGPAPRFVEALRDGSLRILDSTCPAVYAGLQAGQKGLPFIPLRGLLGTDVLANRSDWKVVDNPFTPGDSIAVLPAIRPDVALFHAALADRYGNVFIRREREVLLMAQAARRTLVTVEEITDDNLLEDDARAGAVLPAIYVTRIAVVKRGAWPLSLLDRYPTDETALARYASMARTREGFASFVADWPDQQRAAA
jgi:glutaconate CoA-transferase, subunit A